MSATLTSPAPPAATTPTAPLRVPSVDILRGVTIALMILVNDPGDWEHLFRQLDHAAWNGWTLTDLVFPTFLFLMGASMVFSFDARAARGDCRATTTGHVFARAGKILLLQFVLVFFPRMQWHGMRLFGVLPRIALCGLLGGLVLLAVRGLQSRQRQAQALVGVVLALLVGYWLLLRWVPVPGVGLPGREVPFLDKTQNLTSWIDRGFTAWTNRWLGVGSLFGKTRDPEGLLSTLPAVASTLLGSLAGMWMRAGRVSLGWRQCRLAIAGALGIGAGALWGMWFPINKNLWTSSYVLLSAGWAALALAATSWLVDGRPQPWPRWKRALTWPWLVFGSNAIVAFTVSIVLVKGLIYWKVVDEDGDRSSMWATIYETVFARDHSTPWTSLAFAACFVLVCFLPNWWLWRRKWFFKI